VKTAWRTTDPGPPEPLTAQERGILWRLAVPIGIFAAVVVTSPSTEIPEPYATLAWTAFVLSLSCTLLHNPYLSAIGRRRSRLPSTDAATIILPGRRRREALSLVCGLALVPQAVLWALEERHSTPLQFIFVGGIFWFLAGVVVLGAVASLRRLLRPDNAIRADAAGIACPQLWHSVIPWSHIAGIRTEGARDDTSLLIVFDAPTDLEVRKNAWFDGSAKLDATRRSLSIPDALLGFPADDIAVLLQDRLRQHGHAAV
jgi:hypothetical protein